MFPMDVMTTTVIPGASQVLLTIGPAAILMALTILAAGAGLAAGLRAEQRSAAPARWDGALGVSFTGVRQAA